MKRILVVEDDAAILDIVAAFLEASDYAVETAIDGADALEKVRRQPPDAVLVDLMLPVMDGPAFIAACRREPACARMPIAVMSAGVRPADARRLPVQAFLPKPFELDALALTVRRLT